MIHGGRKYLVACDHSSYLTLALLRYELLRNGLQDFIEDDAVPAEVTGLLTTRGVCAMRIKRTAVAFLITCSFAFLAGTAATADEDESRIAETMLLYQRDSGGWPKNYDADARLDDDAKAKVLAAEASQRCNL